MSTEHGCNAPPPADGNHFNCDESVPVGLPVLLAKALFGRRGEIAFPSPDIETIVCQPFRQVAQRLAAYPTDRVVDPGGCQDDPTQFHAEPFAPGNEFAFG